ncbi:hypothetical protein SteCoe_25784 [Stentor coeruleus]|uniref:Thioredoxin domain-containing protein n=1 Tax=Stentor coeruleus TaxID=5963 RepID=A0A1R2BEE1_9CILI|nr:hypothetical protein SteCoe_25784 [Stentor coeruleus]
MAQVIECTSNMDYQAAIGNAGEKLLIVEFYAEWTTPSQVLSNELSSYLKSLPDSVHLRVNFDSCPEVFQKYSVNILPWVKVIKNGQEIGDIKGACFYKIKQLIEDNYY